MKPAKTNRNFFKLLIILIILILGAKGLYDAHKYSNGVSFVGGGGVKGAENNMLVAAVGYSEKGLLSNMGLPDVNYTNTLPNAPYPFVYTRWPGTPAMLIALFGKVCDSDRADMNIGCLRLLPVIITVLSLFLFARLLILALGHAKSAFLMLMIAVIPVTSETMHGLTHLTYALPLLFIQLGLLLYIFKKKKGLSITNILVLFSLGFLQGTLDWDFFFLVSFSAVPFTFLYLSMYQKKNKKLLVLSILLPSFGFVFAHAIHLVQVSLYYGSFSKAFADIVGAGMARFGAGSLDINYSLGKYTIGTWAGITDRIEFVLKFLFIHNGILLPLFLIAGLAVFRVGEARVIIQKPFLCVLKWSSSGRNSYVILSALLISCMWVIVMFNHAFVHYQSIVKHVLLFYFIFFLTLVESFSSENTENHHLLRT